ncbi:hypothetical protein HGH92_29810 [Chitinophaga varians]|uniref:Uncharacterized protein n=1 Tax=Chitinophaga varians TaxID=2202339 RepID=A0A847S6V2_9BACT|nr:hypothetical protein [Chitinophaga varians]NLR68537.1 hypothetical protein [Chitinophaga varians]
MLLLASTQESSNDLIIKYYGTNEIEISALANSIINIANVIQGINSELYTGKVIQIEISSIENGSFIVHLRIRAFLQNLRRTVFTNDNISTTANIIAIVGGIYGLMLFLKGDKPEAIEKEQNEVIVKNDSGETMIVDNRVYNIYIGNNEINTYAVKSIESIQKDNRITNFELQDSSGQTLVNIPKKSFPAITEKEDIAKAHNLRTITKQGILNIETLSFDHRIKWIFYYEGHKISAKIKDEEFTKMIDSGEQFAKGDKLEAEIEITQEYDSSVDVYIIKSYTITKIINHIPRNNQPRLDF